MGLFKLKFGLDERKLASPIYSHKVLLIVFRDMLTSRIPYLTGGFLFFLNKQTKTIFFCPGLTIQDTRLGSQLYLHTFATCRFFTQFICTGRRINLTRETCLTCSHSPCFPALAEVNIPEKEPLLLLSLLCLHHTVATLLK